MEIKDISEFKEENNALVKKYQELASKYPLEELTYAPEKTLSFPDWEVTEEETNWARSFLSLGNNDQILKVFERSLAHVGTRGLQLLREECSKEYKNIYEKNSKEITQESLLEFLRIEYQASSLYFEEGLRGSRNVYSDFWNGKDDELVSARKSKTLVSDAFIQMDAFVKGNVSTLDDVRKYTDFEYKAHLNIAGNNQNFFMENMGSISPKLAETDADKDNRSLIFWSSLNSFVENLVLGEQQKITKTEDFRSEVK